MYGKPLHDKDLRLRDRCEDHCLRYAQIPRNMGASRTLRGHPDGITARVLLAGRECGESQGVELEVVDQDVDRVRALVFNAQRVEVED